MLLSLGVPEDCLDECDGRSVSLAARHVSHDPLLDSPFARGGGLFSNRISGLANSSRGNEGALAFEDIVRVRGTVHPRRALLSSFCEDIGWLSAQLGSRCKLTLIRHFEPESDRPGIHVLAERLTVVHPQGLPRRGCFHAKLMVLLFDDRVRVAVTTANLSGPDYSAIGQLMWVADFPVRDADRGDSPFVSDLHAFLSGILPESDVDGWLAPIGDIGEHHTAARLVYSKPGTFSNGEAGLPLLHQRLSIVFPQLATNCRYLHVATSSLGNLTHEWIERFPCCGSARARVLFPSEGDVSRASRAGFSGGDVICLNRYSISSPQFPRRLLRHVVWKNRAREPALSHIKALVWTTENCEVLAACVGSHNFTGSAWGYPTTKAAHCGEEAFSMTNYELSVIVPPSCFASLPFTLPAPSYDASDRAWIR